MEEAGQIMMKNTDTIIPEGVEAEVLKYLKFEDLNHQDVFTGNLIFSEKSIYQYMGETNFDEPIRYIFRDFDSAGVDDGVRLENIKALMKNKNFKLFLDKSNAVVKLVLSFPHHDYFTFLDDDDIFDMFLDWLELQWDSPEKEFILANQNDLSSILSRGCRTYDSSWVRTYHHMLPPALADIVNQLIKRGDQDAADFFDQIMSNKIISDWFSYDHKNFAFQQSIIEMSKTGQSKVFFSDTIFRSLRFESLNDSVYHYTPVETLDDLVYHFVRNDRLDILNESLKKLQGQALYKLYEQTVRRILVLFEDDPGCAFKLATGLITENLQIVKNTPPIEVWLDENYTAEELRVVLLEQILLFGKKYQLVSLLEFMFTEYQRDGIVIKKDEALGMATRRRNHEYDQFFRDNLQD